MYEITSRGFFKTCYSVLRKLYLALCRNICQVCVLIMVVTSHVCATSGTWIVLLVCFLLLLTVLCIDHKEVTEVIAKKCLILTVCERLQCRSQFSCPLEVWFPRALGSVLCSSTKGFL